MRDFVVFIFSHGRVDNFYTLDTLNKHGYTGDVFIVIDNEDKQADRYIERFGNKVIIFDKLEASKLFDVGDNFTDRRAIVYARNYSYTLAKKLGYKYFIQLEDDYVTFVYKTDENGWIIGEKNIKNLNIMFRIILNFYKSTDAKIVAFSQGGDFIGAKIGSEYSVSLRKSMNSLFCSTDRPVLFSGRMNDDVNTYVECGRRGDLFLNIPFIKLIQLPTQKNVGGHSDIYKGFGTYVKSFTSVMYAPSCVRVFLMNSAHKRLHHTIRWNNAVPCIIREEYKK